ncbi:uncharacterized protein LOC107037496 [Diachasma alloeum]|uniref:uncharacterized protein LOC107037496 n=1 Tax=Diachasma alloeum TaxID=454923 RepID=UPI00073819DB|nr:uncharacterized protein LOC107037496 [Diachasma alloeum]
MSVDEFANSFVSFLRFISKYLIDFDVRHVAVVWATFVVISIVSTILLRMKETSEFSRNNRKINDRISKILKSEYGKDDQKNRIMVDYRRSARELHTAAARCYQKEYMVQCIDIVSKYPSLVNVRCPISGLTPFHRVCCHRNSCLISFMLGHGADCSITTSSKENALCLLIRSYLQNPSTTDFSSLKILQGAGCFLDRSDKWYSLFLESAILTANKPLALWILEQSPSPVQKQKSFP